MSAEETLIIRPARESDALALARLAELDGQAVPAGRLLLAEVEGVVVAALGVDSEERLADPFQPTADLLALMEARAPRLSPPPRNRSPGVCCDAPCRTCAPRDEGRRRSSTPAPRRVGTPAPALRPRSPVPTGSSRESTDAIAGTTRSDPV